MENMYDLDVALEIVAHLRAIKSLELQYTTNQVNKEKLEKEINELWEESRILHSNSVLNKSIIKKAFTIYAPILKKASLESQIQIEYAAV